MLHDRKRGIVRGAVIGAAALVLSTPLAGFGEDPKLEPELKGYCPAAYLLLGKATQGDPAHASTDRGKLYHLSSAEAKKAFDADPQKFLPQIGGLCTTALGGPYANRFDGDPEVFAVHEGKVYLFSSERARRSYEKRPEHYIGPAAERFARPALQGYCPVSYQRVFRTVLGSEKFKHVHHKWIYHLADAEALAAFQKNPMKYAPQYEGFCTLAVAKNHRYPSDPNVFLPAEGKVFMFADPASKQEFMTNPRRFLMQADANWKELKDKRP
ncbi:MAG: hypothetical protein IID38_11935 [Planctomycetes bacterium]|nr:hypothetical protein [Planctomycetota bacterium]